MPLPQINLAMLVGQDSGMPLHYRKVAGNIADVSTVRALISRNSRPYFLPHGSGISTGQTAPMALQGSFADDVGSQVTAFEPHASRFWLRAAASACGMGVALAGIPGRGLQRSAVAQKAGSRWPPGVSSGCTRGGRGGRVVLAHVEDLLDALAGAVGAGRVGGGHAGGRGRREGAHVCFVKLN